MKILEEDLNKRVIDSDTLIEGSQSVLGQKTEEYGLDLAQEYRDCGEFCFEDFGM